RHPPTSKSIPYTTLFRSQWKKLKTRIEPACYGRRAVRYKSYIYFFCGAGAGKRVQNEVFRFNTITEQLELIQPNNPIPPRMDHRDRKSTRLNSSHVKISY